MANIKHITKFIVLLFCACLINWAGHNVFALEKERVFDKEGNIYYINGNEASIQLTDSGRDSGSMLHLNGEWVYFVRTFEGKFIGEQFYPEKDKGPEDGILKEELWRIDVDGKNEQMLYRNEKAAIDHPSGYAYASLDNIQISPDGDKIYFETAQWVTSNALNVMDPDGSNVKMLGAGNETKIIVSTMDSEKDYMGYIVTNQHRYWLFGGSYDWYWLYDPEWNKIAPLGPDMEYFTGTWDIKYTDRSEAELMSQ